MTETPQDLVAAGDRSVIGRMLQYAAVAPDAVVEESEDLLLVKLGSDLPPLNSAFVTHVPADPAGMIEQARVFFARFGLPWSLKTTSEVAEAIAPAAEAAGLALDETLPGMLLHLLAAEPVEVPGLTIEQVRDDDMLRTFRHVSAGNDPLELYDVLYPVAVLTSKEMALYVGFLAGRPVASAARFSMPPIAGIGGVHVLPEARRRGIGAAMTWRAALDGVAEGCTASYLESTRMGYGVYERMGYRHVRDHLRWHAPAGGEMGAGHV